MLKLRAMQLTLVVPDLAAVPDEHRFGSPTTLDVDLDTAIVVAAGAARDTPIAPLAARGAGFDPGNAYTLRADPVAFVAGRDDVLLAGRVDDLTVDEAHALQAALNRHFALDHLEFHTPRADAWFVTASEHVPVVTHSLASIGGPIAPHLPEGDNGRIWRRWLSEMQMILHGSSVNEAREAAGRAPVTGIWIAGGGVMPRELRIDATIYATEGYRGDVARGLSTSAAIADKFADIAGTTHALVVASTASLARDWLDPALAALDRGTLERFDLIGERGGSTLRWSAARRSWWRRMLGGS